MPYIPRVWYVKLERLRYPRDSCYVLEDMPGVFGWLRSIYQCHVPEPPSIKSNLLSTVCVLSLTDVNYVYGTSDNLPPKKLGILDSDEQRRVNRFPKHR